MADVYLDGISKSYGKNKVVDNLSLKIEDGHLLTLLGPSGCGKTTTLRMIAGFIRPDNGCIYVGGKDVTDIPPYKRNTGMVFQQYALFPHMTVKQNVDFGLSTRKIDRDIRKKRIDEALSIVGLTNFAERYPKQLSGGQQQRVALARVLAIQPQVLLFDEPLSNLDAKLRLEMRSEVRRIQQEVGITSVFVTHDQEEAIMVSDTIAVMNKGRIEQIGTPIEIFYKPETQFVAEFVGTTNFISGKVAQTISELSSAVVECVNHVRIKTNAAERFKVNDSVMIGVRPERIGIKRLGYQVNYENVMEAEIIEASWMGTMTKYVVKAASDIKISINQQNLGEKDNEVLKVGERVQIYWSSSSSCCYKYDE